MKLEKIKIEKFLVLENIEKEINGKNLWLRGDNGVGKSSFLRLIKIALGDQTDIPANIEDGFAGEIFTSKNGEQYKLSVKFKGGKPIITILYPDGLKDDKKASLAAICGINEFDVDKFVGLSKTKSGQKEQVVDFKKMLPKELQESLARYERDLELKEQERTEIGREVKEKKVLIEKHPLIKEVGAGKKFPFVDVKKLIEKKEEVKNKLNGLYLENKKANDEKRSVFEKLKEKTRKDILDFNVEQTKRTEAVSKAVAAETVLIGYGYAGKEVQKFIESLPNPQPQKIYDESKPEQPKYIDERPDDKEMVDIDKEIANATETNSKAKSAKELEDLIELHEKVSTEYGEATVLIETKRQTIIDAITDMDSPIEGLTYDENGLVYNGVPVNSSNLSTSEIMELGIRIKMAENPDLQMLFVQNGQNLGSARLQEIFDLCEKNGWELFMEEVVRGQKELSIEIMEQ